MSGFVVVGLLMDSNKGRGIDVFSVGRPLQTIITAKQCRIYDFVNFVFS